MDDMTQMIIAKLDRTHGNGAEKDSKKDARKFPLMFDIAERAQKAKAVKEKAAKADKEKAAKAVKEKVSNK